MRGLSNLRTKLITLPLFFRPWQLKRPLLPNLGQNMELCHQNIHYNRGYRLFISVSTAPERSAGHHEHGSSATARFPRGCELVCRKLKLHISAFQRPHHRSLSYTSQGYIHGNLFQCQLESLGNINCVSVRNRKRVPGHIKKVYKETVDDTDDEESDDDEQDTELFDEDSSDDDDDDEFIRVFDGDAELPSKYKELKTYVKSLRLDAIVSAGLNMPRNKVEDHFLDSKLRHNGEKVLKKSKQISVGDWIDLVSEVQDNTMKVKRIRIVDISKEKTGKDKHAVFLRAWRGNVTLPRPDSY